MPLSPNCGPLSPLCVLLRPWCCSLRWSPVPFILSGPQIHPLGASSLYIILLGHIWNWCLGTSLWSLSPFMEDWKNQRLFYDSDSQRFCWPGVNGFFGNMVAFEDLVGSWYICFQSVPSATTVPATNQTHVHVPSYTYLFLKLFLWFLVLFTLSLSFSLFLSHKWQLPWGS